MFSPRGPTTRSQASPFTPNIMGTPGKKGFSTPRRTRDGRSSQAGSRSLQVSQILDDTARYRVESFGVPLPVLIKETLTMADRMTEVTVKMDPSGFAWLVGGRKLFIWRYKPSATRGVNCKELTLPPSDLAHSAARVCVLSSLIDGQPTACVAVSPEGVVRYWANIAYEASTAEVSAELKGEECACVVNFQPHGCLLATTTSSLLLLRPSCGQNSISCAALKFSQGMFSGIGRRMSSFIFGASTAQTSGAPLQALIAGDEDKLEGARPFFVLSDAHLQKWTMSKYSPEKLQYQIDALRLLKDAMARRVWDQESVNLPQLHAWLLDMQLTWDGVIILGAATNLESSQDIYYVLALISTSDGFVPTQLDQLTLLEHTERYDARREEELLNYHLLLPSLKSQEALIYSDKQIFIKPLSDTLPADKMDLQFPGDQLLGAGKCDGNAIFFSSTHGMFCVALNRTVEQSIFEEVGEESLLRSEQSTMGFNFSQVAELSQSDDKLSRFKACFITSLTGNQDKVELMLEAVVPAQGLDSEAADGHLEMDRLVTCLSKDLIDDYPSADPRWPESVRPDGGSSSSLIIVQQLRDKIRAHDYFRSFLKKYNLWDQLSTVDVGDREMNTRLLLCEHVEKLEAAISLREQEAEPKKLVDICIRRVLTQRCHDLPQNLNPEDVFFREVSRVDEIAGALWDYEMEQLSAGIPLRLCVQLILTVNGLLQTMLSAAVAYRQSKADNYHSSADTPMPEYIPWTSQSGPNGLRIILSKQIALTVDRGLSESKEVEKRGALFQQLTGLINLLLDTYSSQLESLGSDPRHAQRYKNVLRQFQEQRCKLIQPLLEFEQFDLAASVAEKYFDFDVLISICDASHNQERLHRYITQFEDKGFSEHLFNWFLKEGKRGLLLSQNFTKNPELQRFLASDNTRYLSWVHEISSGDFSRAHHTLLELARAEQIFLSKRKTLLSLSKLSALACGEPPESTELTLGAINEELAQVDCQEAVPKEALEKVGLDPDNMRVLSTSELIRLYAGNENEMANEMDFKTALDLLLYIDQAESPEEYNELKLFIWSQAILHDKDRWTDSQEKDPIKMRNETLFFKTVDLIYNEGEDLGLLLPSSETLLEGELLGDLRHNTHFQFLLKAGYEVIGNILLSG